MEITRQDLQRRDKCRHPHGHAQHFLRVFGLATAQQMPGTRRTDDKRRRQISRERHVDQAIREAGVEDNRKPVDRDELPYFIDFITRGCVHPAVHCQNPSGR